MNYPLISEYIEAIRSAEDNFDKLSFLRLVLDDNGNPVMSSGNFAVVFKMKDERDGKFYALKCFTRDQEHRNENYRKIAEELEFVSSSYLVHFRFFEKELFVDTTQSDEEEFPVLMMDWVEGLPLDVYLRNHLSDDYERQMLAYRFCQMGAWLLSQPFAHGDLKPDNILVKHDGTLVLVDYDGMYVPAMKGQKAQELGSPDYRHPLRTENDFNEHIDDFAIASIALSLKAISIKISLYYQYSIKDRLLFSASDYCKWGNSSVIRSLLPLISDSVFTCSIFAAFILALSKKELTIISYQLFDLKDMERPLNTIATKEEIASGIKDEYGVIYSSNGTKLIRATKNLDTYVIKDGTIIICDEAFSKECIANQITIPPSVKAIGKNVFITKRKHALIAKKIVKHIMGVSNIINKSPFFAIQNKSLYTKNYSKLIYCWNTQETICLHENTYDFKESRNDVRFLKCPICLEVSDKCGERIYKHFNQRGVQVLKINSEKDFLIKNESTIVTSSDVYIDELGVIYSSDKKILYRYSTYIRNEEYKVLDGCEVIDSYAFQYDVDVCADSESCDIYFIANNLKRIILPESLKEIRNAAFAGCNQIEMLKIPRNVKRIGDYAFSQCEKLLQIHFEGLVWDLSDKSMGKNPKSTEFTIEVKNPSKQCHIIVQKDQKDFYARYFRNIIEI